MFAGGESSFYGLWTPFFLHTPCPPINCLQELCPVAATSTSEHVGDGEVFSKRYFTSPCLPSLILLFSSISLHPLLCFFSPSSEHPSSSSISVILFSSPSLYLSLSPPFSLPMILPLVFFSLLLTPFFFNFSFHHPYYSPNVSPCHSPLPFSSSGLLVS